MRAHTGTELAVDLALAQAMVKALEDYLLSDRLFYQLLVHTPAGDRQPKLTPGVLIETLNQLRRARNELSPEQQRELDQIEADFAAIKRRMRDYWPNKVLAELNSLLDSWTWFMQDCDSKSQRHRCETEYDSEVWIRARITTLLSELGGRPDLSELRHRLAILDTKLGEIFRPGKFVWDSKLEKCYPKEVYWFLYGKPGFGDEDDW
jgi:hypothetical protein